MVTNSVELKNIIKKRGLKYGFICSELGITRSTLRNKIENRNEFNASEIYSICSLLGLSIKEKENIFFAK